MDKMSELERLAYSQKRMQVINYELSLVKNDNPELAPHIELLQSDAGFTAEYGILFSDDMSNVDAAFTIINKAKQAQQEEAGLAEDNQATITGDLTVLLKQMLEYVSDNPLDAKVARMNASLILNQSINGERFNKLISHIALKKAEAGELI